MKIINFFRFVFGENKRIKAVQDHDFPEYLKRIGIYDKVVSETQFCVSCGIRITLENLQAVIPNNDNVHFICDKPSCLK